MLGTHTTFPPLKGEGQPAGRWGGKVVCVPHSATGGH